MTDMTAVSDTPPEEGCAPIAPERTVTARLLARNTAAILREVADEGHSFAVVHFGRVVGFLVPRGGRELVRRNGKVSYEVPKSAPLLDLATREATALRVLGDHDGRAVLDELIAEVGSFRDAAVAVTNLEISEPPLARKAFGGYELTDEGSRHYEALKA